MNETISLLRALQEIDILRAKCLRDTQRIPLEQQQRLNEVEAVRMRLERGREEVKRMRAEEKTLELELKSRDEKLEKLKIQANMARDTSILLATNHQIQTIKGESSKMEDRALGLVDRIAELEKDFDKLEKELAKTKEDYEKFAQSCEKEFSLTKETLAGLEKKRAEAGQALPGEVFEIYSRLLQAREGVAVCALEEDYCSGCSTAQLPNDIVKIRQAREVVRCKSCSRILYVSK
ncbi:MAG: zinc ribbon domain-containing protein [Planctomycetota bacterium]